MILAHIMAQKRCLHTCTPLWLRRACSTADEQELQVMPLTRSMAESESACAPLPTTLASKPAPSTRLTSCFCKHQTSHQHMHVRETQPMTNPKQDLYPS